MAAHCRLHDPNDKVRHDTEGPKAVPIIVRRLRDAVAVFDADHRRRFCNDGCYVGQDGALVGMEGTCCLCAEFGYEPFDLTIEPEYARISP